MDGPYENKSAETNLQMLLESHRKVQVVCRFRHNCCMLGEVDRTVQVAVDFRCRSITAISGLVSSINKVQVLEDVFLKNYLSISNKIVPKIRSNGSLITATY